MQVGFFDIVIIPLFHTFGKVFGNCKPLLTYVMRNYRYWADLQQQMQQLQAQADAAASKHQHSSPRLKHQIAAPALPPLGNQR